MLGLLLIVLCIIEVILKCQFVFFLTNQYPGCSLRYHIVTLILLVYKFMHMILFYYCSSSKFCGYDDPYFLSCDPSTQCYTMLQQDVLCACPSVRLLQTSVQYWFEIAKHFKYFHHLVAPSSSLCTPDIIVKFTYNHS